MAASDCLALRALQVRELERQHRLCAAALEMLGLHGAGVLLGVPAGGLTRAQGALQGAAARGAARWVSASLRGLVCVRPGMCIFNL